MNSPQEHSAEYFRTFILKVAARCNINCSYCYEYNLADQSWASKPPRMSRSVLDKAVERIAEHVESNGVGAVNFIFHGGEPLIAGLPFFRYAVKTIHDRLEPLCKVSCGIQSNGTLIDEEWCRGLLELGLTVGISVDGYRELNDRFRVDHCGRSTFDRVERGLRLLSTEEYRQTWSGMLCVIQPDSDPEKLIRWFAKWGEVKLDLLLPHHNHHARPPQPFLETEGYGYGRWLARAFDAWWGEDLARLKVRIFEDIIHLLLGGYFTVESFGLSPVRIAVVQTDGAYEALDSLKSTYDGAVSTGLSVFEDSLDEVLSENLIQMRLHRFDTLSSKCQDCGIVKVCGGGYIPHRYDLENGFAMPSIYCHDLAFLISHIARRLLGTADPDLVQRVTGTIQVTKGGQVVCPVAAERSETQHAIGQSQ